MQVARFNQRIYCNSPKFSPNTVLGKTSIPFHWSRIISLDSNSFIREMCGTICLHGTQKSTCTIITYLTSKCTYQLWSVMYTEYLLMRENHHADRFTRTSFQYDSPNTILPRPEDGTEMSLFGNHFLS